MELGRGPLQNVRIMNGLDPDFGSKCPDYERRSGQKSPKMSGFLNGNSGGFSGVLKESERMSRNVKDRQRCAALCIIGCLSSSRLKWNISRMFRNCDALRSEVVPSSATIVRSSRVGQKGLTARRGLTFTYKRCGSPEVISTNVSLPTLYYIPLDFPHT